ncbi:MAG: hypothetical protein PHY52_01945 [Candidatus Pacebacteria bacterium]|nr:hypothetical protein [Candidatus Paceibacterota bacterium]
MQEKDIIKKISEFKKIQPNHDWVIWLKANILEIKPQNLLHEKPRVRLASFSFINKYQKAFIPAFLGLFFVFSFSFAQTALPGNILYPIKTLTQDAKIYLASENTKPVVRLEVAKARMEDLSKVQNHEQEISEIVKIIKKDLGLVPQEIKKIDKKQIALDVSKDVQERSKDLQVMADKIILEENDKEELSRTVKNAQSQVLALIMETTEEINQCPSFLSNDLVELGERFTDIQNAMIQLPNDEIIKMKNLLIEASASLKAGDCLAAMEKIESINQLLSFLSLDVQVETSTPEKLDEESSIISPQEELEENDY